MNREQWWHMLPVAARRAALMIAGLDPERAVNPVATFTNEERARVRAAIFAHVEKMELIAQCMHASNTLPNGFLH